MTLSRAVGIASGAGAALSGIGSTLNIINPKWGAIIAGVGAAITMFCERATGSPEYRRRQRMKKQMLAYQRADNLKDSPPLPVAESERATGPLEK